MYSGTKKEYCWHGSGNFSESGLVCSQLSIWFYWIEKMDDLSFKTGKISCKVDFIQGIVKITSIDFDPDD